MSTAVSDPVPEPVEMTAARLPKEIVKQAVFIAQHRGITVGELIGDMVRTPLLREYREVLDELRGELGGEGG